MGTPRFSLYEAKMFRFSSSKYLILTKFCEYLILRKVKRHISRVLNFAILRENENLSVLNFAIFCYS